MSNGLTTGMSMLANGVAAIDTSIKNREEAKILQQERSMALNKYNMDMQTQQDSSTNQQAQTKELIAKTTQLANDNARKNTFDALRAYTVDGNVRHLNRMVKEDPVLKEVYQDTANLSRVDPTNDIDLIRAHDLDPSIFTNPDTAAAANKRIVKVTMTDGSTKLVDMLSVYAATGFTKQMNDEDLAERLKEAQINKYNRKGGDGEGSGSSNGTAMMQNATAVAGAKERIAAGKGTAADAELVKFGAHETAGVIPGRMDYADEATKNLVDTFGGEDKFFNTDFGDPGNFRKAYPFIAKIEAAEGVEWTTEDRKQLNDIRVLIASGNAVSGLTETATGVLDNFLNTTKKYIFENAGDSVKATSAYSAFRNTVRHALYGSALTDGEIKAFNEAFGGLGQKLGPVLEQFKTALVQTKAKLNSIATMNNPYSAKVRLGVDQESLDGIIHSLDQRISFLDSRRAIDPKRKATMDAVFKGTK